MSSVDNHSDVKKVIALAPVVIATDTTTDGLVIDTHQDDGYESVEFAIATGVLTDGNYLALLEESDVVTFGGEENVVAAEHRLGALPNFADDTDDAAIARVGYIGKKRYVRLAIVSDTTTTGVVIAAIATLGNPKRGPVAEQAG